MLSCPCGCGCISISCTAGGCADSGKARHDPFARYIPLENFDRQVKRRIEGDADAAVHPVHCMSVTN